MPAAAASRQALMLMSQQMFPSSPRETSEDPASASTFTVPSGGSSAAWDADAGDQQEQDKPHDEEDEGLAAQHLNTLAGNVAAVAWSDITTSVLQPDRQAGAASSAQEAAPAEPSLDEVHLSRDALGLLLVPQPLTLPLPDIRPVDPDSADSTITTAAKTLPCNADQPSCSTALLGSIAGDLLSESYPQPGPTASPSPLADVSSSASECLPSPSDPPLCAEPPLSIVDGGPFDADPSCRLNPTTAAAPPTSLLLPSMLKGSHLGEEIAENNQVAVAQMPFAGKHLHSSQQRYQMADTPCCMHRAPISCLGITYHTCVLCEHTCHEMCLSQKVDTLPGAPYPSCQVQCKSSARHKASGNV